MLGKRSTSATIQTVDVRRTRSLDFLGAFTGGIVAKNDIVYIQVSAFLGSSNDERKAENVTPIKRRKTV